MGEPDAIRVGDMATCTIAMGPGKRFCLWVTGCPMQCSGCASPGFQDPRAGDTYSVAELACRIADAKQTHGIEGVSVSGGEPFVQARALSGVLAFARGIGLSTLVWSGYLRSRLERPDAPDGSAELLAHADVLIDGPFIESRMAGDPLRGSDNQRIHLLTSRYRDTDFTGNVLDVRMDHARGTVAAYGVTDTRSFAAILRILGVTE